MAKFRQECREQKAVTRGSSLDALWARAWEHAAKVALVLACGNSPFSPDGSIDPAKLVITGEIAGYATQLVGHLVTDLVQAVRNNVAGSDFEKDLLLVQRAIQDAGPEGIKRYMLVRQSRRLDPRRFDAVLQRLKESGTVVQVTPATGKQGVKPTVYVWKGGQT
jgi:hypothetical protein